MALVFNRGPRICLPLCDIRAAPSSFAAPSKGPREGWLGFPSPSPTSLQRAARAEEGVGGDGVEPGDGAVVL